MPSPVIDVHTHCLTEQWFSLLQQHGGPRYGLPSDVDPIEGWIVTAR